MAGGLEIALWWLLVIATITDLFWGKIFNLVTFPFLGLGLVARFWVGGVAGVSEAGLAVFVAFVLFFPLYALKTLAAADVKLLMALGAWTSTRVVIELAVISILFGALVGLAVLIRKAGIRGGARSVAEHARSMTKPKHSHRMPFAPAFLCAFVFLKIAEIYQWTWF